MNTFIGFLAKFKDSSNSPLIESIESGYKLLYESSNTDSGKISVECRDSNGTLNDLLKLYKESKVSGTFILDPESHKPTAIHLQRISKNNPSANISHSIDIEKIENVHKDDTKRIKYEITITATSSDRCNSVIESLKELFTELGKYGNGGHTYDIQFVPHSQGKMKMFCWDGDGSDFIDIDSITVSK